MLTQEIIPKISRELSHWEKDRSERRILLIVNAYTDVKTVYQVLNQSSLFNGHVMMLGKNTQDKDVISRNQLQTFKTLEGKDILIAPLLAMNRGHNILDDQDKSLFGSVFFLVRPYPTPNDFHYYIQILHHHYHQVAKRLIAEGKVGLEAIRQIRRKSRGLLEQLYQDNDFWSRISDADRRTIAWFVFIPLWQLVGRLLRGGTDARVIYVDSKFFYQSKGKTRPLISYWQEILNENKDEIQENLYGPFIDSLNEIKDYEELI